MRSPVEMISNPRGGAGGREEEAGLCFCQQKYVREEYSGSSSQKKKDIAAYEPMCRFFFFLKEYAAFSMSRKTEAAEAERC